MPRIHPYGEPREEESPIGEFFCWLFIIGLALPASYGWVLVNSGLITNTTLFTACGGLGVIVGLKAAIRTARNKRRAKASAFAVTREAGKEGPQNPPQETYHPEGKPPAVLHPAGADCEACQTPSNAQHSGSNNAFAQAHLVADRWVGNQGLLLDNGLRNGGDGGDAIRHHRLSLSKRQG